MTPLPIPDCTHGLVDLILALCILALAGVSLRALLGGR